MGLFDWVRKKKRKSLTYLDVFEPLSMGNECVRRGRPAEALSHYQKALSAAVATGDSDSEGQILALMGKSYLDLGKPDEALEALSRALALTSERGDVGFAEMIGALMELAKRRR